MTINDLKLSAVIADPSIRDRHRIMSIDPGTNHLGYAISDVYLGVPDSLMTVVHVETLDAFDLARRYTTLLEVHGEKVTKLYALEQALKRIIERFKPDIVISESPYMARFPNAFSALIECLKTIRSVLIEYDPCMALKLIDPATIKSRVGVSGKSGNKDLMTNAIKRLINEEKISFIDTSILDEHSIDAIAVGYAFKSL